MEQGKIAVRKRPHASPFEGAPYMPQQQQQPMARMGAMAPMPQRAALVGS